jgi:hypothetical protein
MSAVADPGEQFEIMSTGENESPHWQAWQERIQAAFSTQGGSVGERYLLAILQAEKAIGREYQIKFHGHRLLTEASFDFFVETLTAVANRIRQQGWPEHRENYFDTVLAFVTLLRTMRAADMLAVGGYRLDGYAHLRGVMDQIIRIVGVANGWTTFSGVHGVAGYAKDRKWTEAEFEKIHANKVKVEKEIHRKLIGSDSGLSQRSIEALRNWDRMFDKQVHGAQWTFISEAKFWVGRHDASVSLAPRMIDDDDAMFINQSDRLHWMAHRLLPTLQVEGREFGNAWGERWNVLDGAFRQMSEALSRMGKPLADAIIELVDVKFQFNPGTYYVER